MVENKTKIVENLVEKLSRSTVLITTDYRGMSAPEMSRLRSQLAQQGIEYRVVKNTLTRLAAQQAEKGEFITLLTGPVAIAFGYAEETQPARVLTDFIRASGASLQIKGGLLGGHVLTSEDISALASLPSSEILLSRLVFQLQTPLARMLAQLVVPLQSLANVLKGRMQQLEGGKHGETD